jgi:hypothetical protein
MLLNRSCLAGHERMYVRKEDEHENMSFPILENKLLGGARLPFYFLAYILKRATVYEKVDPRGKARVRF